MSVACQVTRQRSHANTRTQKRRVFKQAPTEVRKKYKITKNTQRVKARSENRRAQPAPTEYTIQRSLS